MKRPAMVVAVIITLSLNPRYTWAVPTLLGLKLGLGPDYWDSSTVGMGHTILGRNVYNEVMLDHLK